MSNQKAYDTIRESLSFSEIRVDESLIIRGTDFLQDVVDAISKTPSTDLDIFDPVDHAKGLVNIGTDTLIWKIIEVSNDNRTSSNEPLLKIDLFRPLSKSA